MQAVAFSPDATIVAVGDHNGSTYMWNLATRTIIATLHTPQEYYGVSSVAFSSDNVTIATSDHVGVTLLWHLARSGR